MVAFNDLYQAINDYAPKSLSDEFCKKYSAYDNSGHLIGKKRTVNKVLASLDFSRGAVDRAIKENAEVIFTHHPAIYGGISSIKEGDPLGEKIIDCLEHHISVISMHLNLDCAAEGIDHYLMKGITSAVGNEPKNIKIFSPLSLNNTGYGRGYEINEVSFSDMVSCIKKEFNTNQVNCFGENKKIYKCVSFCGAGSDEEAILQAKEFGADVIISSDFKHHLISMARELHINVIALTHYASENYGFQIISKKIIDQLGLSFVYHTDNELL